MSAGTRTSAQEQQAMIETRRARVVICTDLTSGEAGVREPDDAQSLIRLLLHLDGLDLEGILPGSGLNHGQVVYGEAIAHRLIDAYGEVWPMLVRHDVRYPLAAQLHGLVHVGQPLADRTVPPEVSVGPGRDTAASRHLVRLIARPDPRPLHVCLWGGAADLAQALWSIGHEQGPRGLRAAAACLRVHAIGDQDSTALWAKQRYPKVPWITRQWGYRGMYRGGDATLVGPQWIRERILPQGALCGLFPVYDGGDIWSGSLGRVTGIKEGDTPSWLGLIPNGLHVAERPEWGGWGGRVRADGPCRWTCEGVADRLPGDERDPRPEMSGVYRWRSAVQAAFALRARRCVAGPDQVPSEPVVRPDGEAVRIAEPGTTLQLSVAPLVAAAPRMADDAVPLTYSWWLYTSAGTATRQPELRAGTGPACTVVIPASGLDGTVHLIAECTSARDHDARGYARFLLLPPPESRPAR